MAHRIFDNIIERLAEQYQQTTGNEFSPADHPNPAGLSDPVLEITRQLKVLIAEQRQMEIIEIIRRFDRKGNAFIVPDDQLHLLDEFDSLKKEVEKWSVSPK